MKQLPVSYSVGFLVSPDGKEILLLKKARPSFIANTWGAFGGHIEPNETPFEAMVREAKEEADLSPLPWTHLGVVHTRERPDDPIGTAQIVVFAARGDVYAARAMTDEPLEVFSIDQIDELSMSDTTRLVLPRVLAFVRGKLDVEFTPPSPRQEHDHLYAVRLACSVWGVSQQLEIDRHRTLADPQPSHPVLSFPKVKPTRIRGFDLPSSTIGSTKKLAPR